MSLDPVADLVAQLRDLTRRLEALETAPRAPYTSVRGGATRWYAESGDTPVIYVGDLANDGDVGIWITDVGDTGALFVGTVNGEETIVVRNRDFPANQHNVLHLQDGALRFPGTVCAWGQAANVNIDVQGRPTVASSTYTELWHAVLPVTTDVVDTVFGLFCGVAPGAGQVRITMEEYRGGGDQVVVYESAIETGTTTHNGSWNLPDVDGESPVGRTMWFRLWARRTAGASPIAVGINAPLLTRRSASWD